jgi:hypothetical protein
MTGDFEAVAIYPVSLRKTKIAFWALIQTVKTAESSLQHSWR